MKIQTYFSMRGCKWQKLEGPQRKAFLMYLAPGSFTLSQAGCHNLFDCHMKCPDLDEGRWRVVNMSLIAQVMSVNPFFGTVALLFSPQVLMLRSYMHITLDTDLTMQLTRCLRRRDMSNWATEQHFLWQELKPSLTVDKTLCMERYFQFLRLHSLMFD